MSIPTQHGPQQPSQDGGKAVMVAVLLAVGLMAGLCCAGICGGLAFFYSRVDAPRIVQRRFQQQNAQVNTPPDVMEWIVRSQLSRAYTQALDAVTANKDVIAALGDAVDTTNDPNMLFRRANVGELQGDEMIEFEIEGQRGAAVVSVVCAPAQISQTAAPPGMAGGYEPKEITVKLTGGTLINVPPPVIETPQGGR